MSSTNSLTVEDLGSAAQRDRRKRILDATIALAPEGGFDAVQMRAVAEQADVALGTLYRYFPSKIHLLVSALGREFERAEAALRRQADPRRHRRPSGSSTCSARPPAASRATRTSPRRSPARSCSPTPRSRPRSTTSACCSPGCSPAPCTPSQTELTDDDIAIARVIGDVWLSALVGWVTGRTSAADTAAQMEKAVHLLLRD